jgi:hypothetical protein
MRALLRSPDLASEMEQTLANFRHVMTECAPAVERLLRARPAGDVSRSKMKSGPAAPLNPPHHATTHCCLHRLSFVAPRVRLPRVR